MTAVYDVPDKEMTAVEYVNTDTQERVWPSIQKPDGTTLELAAGETVELEVEISDDPYLKPAAAAADLGSLKLPALRDHAAELGVPEPHKLRSKQAVLDAIEALQSNGEPDGEEPDGTEGDAAGAPADQAESTADDDADPAAGDDDQKE